MAGYDSMLQIPVARATSYDHEDVAWEAPDVGIHVLEVDHLGVDDCVTEGRVTLSASGSPTDGYGFEVDLEPEAARALARQFTLAVSALEQEG